MIRLGQTDHLLTQALDAAGFALNSVGSIQLKGSSSGNTVLQGAAAGSGTMTVPAGTDTLVALALAQTIGNKTLSNTNSATFKTNSITFQDATTTNKQMIFACSAITSGQTRTKTWQNNSGTVAELNVAQTFTQIQTLNNGATSYGFGLSLQTGGLSFGDYLDSATTGADAIIDTTSTKDYSQIELTNTSLTSVAGAKLGNAFNIRYINNTGNSVTFKHNQSVGVLETPFLLPSNSDVVVPNRSWLEVTFSVNEQKLFGKL